MTTLVSDADLISASRSGDRSAFGQVVRRYQAMISGLIYAACGDLHRSEDIAQDTFIAAWKSLSGLRDPSKLPGWLCRIARRRLADSARKSSAHDVPFSQAFASGQEPAAPVDPPTVEECAFLWETLSRIPQPYRETLVLFYRQEHSTAQVAAAMETTESAVRQRLTRGRQMLREEVAVQLERDLARTAPSGQFATQVVAALPAVAAQSAGLGASVKGAAAVKGGTLLAILLGWVAPIGLLFGMIFGAVQDLRAAQAPRQRRLAVLFNAGWIVLIVAYAISINRLVAASRDQNWALSTTMQLLSASSCLFAALGFGLTVWNRWQTEKVLREQNLIEPPFPNIPLWKRLFFTFPVVAICVGWMIRLAMNAGDQLSVDLIAGAIVVESVWFAWRLPQLQPSKPIQQTFETFALALAVIVVMLNWRGHLWIGRDMPLAGINSWAIVLAAWLVGLWGWDRRAKAIVA